jgi:hypothetical protein
MAHWGALPVNGLKTGDTVFKFLLWLKIDSDIYYHKTNDRAATKSISGDMGYPLGGPRLYRLGWGQWA